MNYEMMLFNYFVSYFLLVAASNDSSKDIEEALRTYQKQMLSKLIDVREKLVNEVGDYSKLQTERDSLHLENVALRKESERMNYRIKHLIKALNIEESKNTSN